MFSACIKYILHTDDLGATTVPLLNNVCAAY